MSLGNVLQIARSALLAHQQAMAQAANNVANASTPGYSRRRVVLETLPALGGVGVAYIERVRDAFRDVAYRREAGNLGTATTLRNFLTPMESAFLEPANAGVSDALDTFFQSYGDLAADPRSPVAREEVRHAAQRFILRVHELAATLDQSATEATDRLTAEVTDLNKITAEIADLNQRIVVTQATGGADPDLLDRRDLLLDRLAEKVSVQVHAEDNGSATVVLQGAILVSGGKHRDLEMKDLPGGGYSIGLAGDESILDPGSGTVNALVDLTATIIPGFRRQLDDLVSAVVSEVNAIHRTGTTGAGNTQVNFFDPNNLSADSISLSAEVAASAQAVGAGFGPETGDNSMALTIAGLAGKKIPSLGGRTFTEHYGALASSVGLATRDAMDNEAAAATLTDQADAWRTVVSGVATDEEMVTLITVQEAFAAAARLLNVADEMIQELLGIAR